MHTYIELFITVLKWLNVLLVIFILAGYAYQAKNEEKLKKLEIKNKEFAQKYNL
jgi:hypothetical protein